MAVRGLIARLAGYWRDRRGSISPMLVMALVPMIGALAVGMEGSNWWLTQRSMQNAADTAALAAAQNAQNGSTTAAGSGSASSYATTGCSTNPQDFDCEAVIAASQAGFTNGANNVAVYPQYLTTGCPGITTQCFKVTITKKVPLYLLTVLGFAGDTTTSSGRAQTVQAIAVAGNQVHQTPDCILSLATGNVAGIKTDGSPSVDLNGCSIQSNSSGTQNPNYAGKCGGHNLQADAFSSPGVDNGCGKTAVNGAPTVADPYAALASNIPADPCGGQPANYPQEPKNQNGTPLPASNLISGVVSYSATKTFCGDVQLTAALTVSSTSTIVIYNGMLDLNGKNFTADAGATIIFAGSNTVGTGGSAITPNHTWTSEGNTFDLGAPTVAENATWHGVAIYQAPNLTTNVDVTIAGNQPLNISGVVYLPWSNVTYSGDIQPADGGAGPLCFILVSDTLTLNGSGTVFANSQSQCPNYATQVFGETNIFTLVQ